MKFILILTLFMILQVHSEGSNRRFLKQLRNFRREVRGDLEKIETNISILFDTMKDLKKSGITVHEDPRGNETGKQDRKCAVDYRQDIDEVKQVNAAILKALESEKRLNRQLQNKLQAVENVLSNIVVDMYTFVSFMTNVKQTITERPKDYTDFSAQTTLTVTTTENNKKKKKELGYDYIEYGPYDAYYDSMVKDTTPSNPGSTRKVLLVTSYCTKQKESGVFGIYLEHKNAILNVYCDAETDGGGWIVIMRRQDGSVDFYRSWDEYKNGFGDVGGEFWIGNDVIHELTDSRSMELRIDMEDYDGNKAYAKYNYFEIGPEAENYILNPLPHNNSF